MAIRNVGVLWLIQLKIKCREKIIHNKFQIFPETSSTSNKLIKILLIDCFAKHIVITLQGTSAYFKQVDINWGQLVK